MELNKIESLLEKYFEGTTTLAEEKILQQYFYSAEVDPDLKQYQPIFAFFTSEKKMPYNPKKPMQSRKKMAWISIAASAAILFGVGLYTFNNWNVQSEQTLGTYNDPEIAFRETQKALTLLSKNVNVGILSVQYVENYECTKNKIFVAP